MKKYTIQLTTFVSQMHLEPAYLADNYEDVLIETAEIHRAGLVLNGFMEYNNPDRIQICGKVEMAFIDSLAEDKRECSIDFLFSSRPPMVVVTRGIGVIPEMVRCAEKYNVSIYTTADSTSNFMADAIAYLNVELAPRITRHGVLVEVYGEGILLLGESGIGKSETAIELVKRGHRLIADDAVELRKVSGQTIVGTSPENIRHYVELRGVGIINVRRIFGMGAVNISEKIDLVINLELWEQGKTYSGLDSSNQFTDILGISIPSTKLPVKPGRNLAVIIEVAAMNNRQKTLGYNAAEELMSQLGFVNEPIV